METLITAYLISEKEDDFVLSGGKDDTDLWGLWRVIQGKGAERMRGLQGDWEAFPY